MSKEDTLERISEAPSLEEEKHGGTVISFFGDEREDIVLYMAGLFAVSNEPVLIVDNSFRHSAYRALGGKKGEGAVYFNNVTSIINAAYQPEFLDNFRYILVFHGFYADKRWWNMSKKRFIVTTQDRFINEDISYEIRSKELDLSEIYFVISGRYSTKIQEKDIAGMLGISSGRLDDLYVYEFDPDSGDGAARISLQYNRIHEMSKLPNPVKSTLYRMFRVTAEKPECNIKHKNLFADAVI